ncbi:hypothetical protein [sulfur-oxidizing endosymbiont of Gigantopelta aegis]|uniref:hypothetical protein n=1 Tax=sulfur-oxidizing endosymbiont of Gigantopelta aegis TaxID=2794934 RepID=UPI0018DE3956|nr:hypothetical protein [sulfur-oxidizing endosymbiont of Gigantopelta aegis]
MNRLNIKPLMMKHTSLVLIGLVVSLSALIPTPVRAVPLGLAEEPLFLTTGAKPNVIVMLDNSGSMKSKMYGGGFNNSIAYYGIFESTQNYEYDPSIPVNAAGYAPMTTIDTTKTGAFKESSCTPATNNFTCWSGNFLNWMTTRRIDASRKVLMGGKLESSTSYTYGSGLNFKLIANNEPRDDNSGSTISRSSSISSQFSPVPNGSSMEMISPAAGGGIKTSYDPYAKLTTAGGGAYI